SNRGIVWTLAVPGATLSRGGGRVCASCRCLAFRGAGGHDGGTLVNDPIPWWQVFEDELTARGFVLPDSYAEFREQNKRLPDREGEITHQLHTVVDAFEVGPSAICLSGGGIRSATFSIGVLQGLAKNNVLPHVDYVSTVSGGG